MHFQRLRLSGFKSFVDPTEFRIEPGLTGVVGPNGCGKSNLLEAPALGDGRQLGQGHAGRRHGRRDLRRRRDRPARNHAEVPLTIDNADRTAPAAVQRPADAGGGRAASTGARARPTASTAGRCGPATCSCCSPTPRPGANSPALVRQGQICELIAAKPQNRRRILEEAAGVSGLHTRRHEAELRLRAAEANLARLDDVGRELETTLRPAEARGAPGRTLQEDLRRDPRAAGRRAVRPLDRGARRRRAPRRRSWPQADRAVRRRPPRRRRRPRPAPPGRGGHEAAARGGDRRRAPCCTGWPSRGTGWTRADRRTRRGRAADRRIARIDADRARENPHRRATPSGALARLGDDLAEP